MLDNAGSLNYQTMMRSGDTPCHHGHHGDVAADHPLGGSSTLACAPLLCIPATMFGRPQSRCSFCHGPLPVAMYYFCCNECQCCWHREHGTVPKGWSKRDFHRLLAEQKQQLDEHERKVKGGGRH